MLSILFVRKLLDYNMVSAKTNVVSTNQVEVRNKDGSIRKTRSRAPNKQVSNESSREEPVVKDVICEQVNTNKEIHTPNKRQEQELVELRLKMDLISKEMKRLTEKEVVVGKPNVIYEDDSDQEQAVVNTTTTKGKNKKVNDSEPLGYRMRLEKFKGGVDENYDAWWADLLAFFALHSYSEKDKTKLFALFENSVGQLFAWYSI